MWCLWFKQRLCCRGPRVQSKRGLHVIPTCSAPGPQQGRIHATVTSDPCPQHSLQPSAAAASGDADCVLRLVPQESSIVSAAVMPCLLLSHLRPTHCAAAAQHVGRLLKEAAQHASWHCSQHPPAPYGHTSHAAEVKWAAWATCKHMAQPIYSSQPAAYVMRRTPPCNSACEAPCGVADACTVQRLHKPTRPP